MAHLSEDEVDALITAIFGDDLERFLNDLPGEVRTFIEEEMRALVPDSSTQSEIKALFSLLPRLLRA